ncbi:hypothetical protein V6N12_030737 [Hibiscus sabdariffa]|uniref:Uncharacterized protein n=1 Tax=Hibiscus sabdariffa TaxID=183260 RepID=A0ABR2E6X8_9ROSI
MEGNIVHSNQRVVGDSNMQNLNHGMMGFPRSSQPKLDVGLSPIHGPILPPGPTTSRLMELGSDGENDPILVDEAARKKNNTITEINNRKGRVVSNTDEIVAVAASYFHDLFSSSTTRNGVAHLLAQAYSRFHLPQYWIEEAPPDVEQAALRDLR